MIDVWDCVSPENIGSLVGLSNLVDHFTCPTHNEKSAWYYETMSCRRIIESHSQNHVHQCIVVGFHYLGYIRLHSAETLNFDANFFMWDFITIFCISEKFNRGKNKMQSYFKILNNLLSSRLIHLIDRKTLLQKIDSTSDMKKI